MKQIDDKIMRERRLDRLKHLNFFMTDERGAKLPDFDLNCAHNLLTGWFSNSHWATAWWCVKKAIGNSWMWLTLTVRIWYYESILRLNEDEIDARICQ